MAAKNDITGDSIQTRTVTDTYRNNYDLIFGKKKSNGSTTTTNAVQNAGDSTNTPTSNPQQQPDQERGETEN